MNTEKQATNTKVKRWLDLDSIGGSTAQPIRSSAQYSTDDLTLLRNRLESLRNATGSFSSQGSPNSTPRPTAAPHVSFRRKSSRFEEEEEEVLNPYVVEWNSWRIGLPPETHFSSSSPGEPPTSGDSPFSSSRKVDKPLTPTPTRSPNPNRIPPQASPIGRGDYQGSASPATPSFPASPHVSSSQIIPEDVGQLDAQLEELNKLTQTLSSTADQLYEDAEPGFGSLGYRGGEENRRESKWRNSSSDDYWKKYNELAAQLQKAKAELDNLDLDKDDDAISWSTVEALDPTEIDR